MELRSLTKIFLYVILAMITMQLYTEWQHDNTIISGVATTNTVMSETTAVSNDQSVPEITAVVNTQENKEVPSLTVTLPPKERSVRIKTNVLDVLIDLKGGNIVQANLLKYPESLSDKVPIQILGESNAIYAIAQSGLVSPWGPDTKEGQALFTTQQTQKHTVVIDTPKTITLETSTSTGLRVEKQLVFHPDSYLVDVTYRIKNTGKSAWIGQWYAQLREQDKQEPRSFFSTYMGYLGPAISSPEKPFEKVSYDNMQKERLNRLIKGGWAAILDHYFLSAWIPDTEQLYQYYSQAASDKVYTIGMLGPKMQLLTGEVKTIKSQLLLGPKVKTVLEQAAPSLPLTLDYGWLWFIATPIFWIMQFIHTYLIANWGWAIVLVTFLIKALFYPLSEKSYRSMAIMRQLQPKVQSLKERCGEDRQKFAQAMMSLYKEEKVNPMGGCLPMLVQIPFFFALYWVLLASVELRQAPFIGWIHDLSIKDPYYVLPVLMGITMLIQQKLSPPPPDPVQARMMMLLPVVFTVLFVNFPAGLVLYWLVNNVLSVLQQWYILRKIEQQPKRKKGKR